MSDSCALVDDNGALRLEIFHDRTGIIPRCLKDAYTWAQNGIVYCWHIKIKTSCSISVVLTFLNGGTSISLVIWWDDGREDRNVDTKRFVSLDQ